MNSLNCTTLNPKSKDIPIILLHGWGGSIESLSPLQQELAKIAKNPIYNIELPGFGSTKMPIADMNIRDYSEFIFNQLKSKGIREGIFIGHSFGGKTLLDTLVSKTNEKYDINVERLVLINSSGIKPKNSIKKVGSRIIKSLSPKLLIENQTLKSIYYKYILRERDYLNAGDLKQTLATVVEEHYDDLLENIDTKTLIIWGEKDNYVPLWMGRKLHQGIKDSELIIVPNATHGLPLSQPRIVAEIIYNWLNNS